jgi:hypothetical protein
MMRPWLRTTRPLKKNFPAVRLLVKTTWMIAVGLAGVVAAVVDLATKQSNGPAHQPRDRIAMKTTGMTNSHRSPQPLHGDDRNATIVVQPLRMMKWMKCCSRNSMKALAEKRTLTERFPPGKTRWGFSSKPTSPRGRNVRNNAAVVAVAGRHNAAGNV